MVASMLFKIILLNWTRGAFTPVYIYKTKLLKFTHFFFPKTTYISGCINVYIYIFAIITVYICYSNCIHSYYIYVNKYFLFIISLSLSLSRSFSFSLLKLSFSLSPSLRDFMGDPFSLTLVQSVSNLIHFHSILLSLFALHRV